MSDTFTLTFITYTLYRVGLLNSQLPQWKKQHAALQTQSLTFWNDFILTDFPSIIPSGVNLQKVICLAHVDVMHIGTRFQQKTKHMLTSWMNEMHEKTARNLQYVIQKEIMKILMQKGHEDNKQRFVCSL